MQTINFKFTNKSDFSIELWVKPKDYNGDHTIISKKDGLGTGAGYMVFFDDPIDKLSTGPIHFAYTGWAKVSIKNESNPTPDENYFLIYTHPQSFEADSYILTRGENSNLPICI